MSATQDAIADVLGTVAIGAALAAGLLYLVTGRIALSLSVGLAVGTTIAVIEERVT